MAGGKGKSVGGKSGSKEATTTKAPKSHSAKAGLQVSLPYGRRMTCHILLLKVVAMLLSDVFSIASFYLT